MKWPYCWSRPSTAVQEPGLYCSIPGMVALDPCCHELITIIITSTTPAICPRCVKAVRKFTRPDLWNGWSSQYRFLRYWNITLMLAALESRACSVIVVPRKPLGDDKSVHDINTIVHKTKKSLMIRWFAQRVSLINSTLCCRQLLAW
jgi:hypothetical protein